MDYFEMSNEACCRILNLVAHVKLQYKRAENMRKKHAEETSHWQIVQDQQHKRKHNFSIKREIFLKIFTNYDFWDKEKILDILQLKHITNSIICHCILCP